MHWLFNYIFRKTSQPTVVDLFGETPLHIFDSVKLTDVPEPNPIWAKLEQQSIVLLRPPENYFEKMAVWTEEGKVWKFPIDNEQGKNHLMADIKRRTSLSIELWAASSKIWAASSKIWASSVEIWVASFNYSLLKLFDLHFMLLKGKWNISSSSKSLISAQILLLTTRYSEISASWLISSRDTYIEYKNKNKGEKKYIFCVNMKLMT